MRLVVFADALGNPFAVEAILQAARKVDGAEIVCLGNAIGPGPDNAATVAKLRKARVILVRGAWEAAALDLAGAPEVRQQAGDILAALSGSDAAFVRDAAPPRRLVLGGKRILLTSEPGGEVGLSDVVLRPGARSGTQQVAGRLMVTVGRADDGEHGESPFVVFDSVEGEPHVHHAAWDRAALQSSARRTRHL